MPNIAPNAYIDPKANIADDAEIGCFCVIGAQVTIGPGCKLHNHVTVCGPTTMGEKNEFYPNCVIGADPQDLKYKGGPTQLVIGSNNIFRENVTVNRGTEVAGGKTIIGDGNLFMAGVHVAHDCVVEDHVIVANAALLAGHVKLERSTVIGGGAAIHHFSTIGRNTMIGGLTRVVTDVPPFMIFDGIPGAIRGVNIRGLIRNGFTERQVDAVKDAYKKLFRGGNFLPALEELERESGTDDTIRYLIDFMRRSMQGKHGRHLETLRQDTPEDLGDFYKEK
jgi:UDP-N-acetylglucosamine acyltransferase